MVQLAFLNFLHGSIGMQTPIKAIMHRKASSCVLQATILVLPNASCFYIQTLSLLSNYFSHRLSPLFPLYSLILFSQFCLIVSENLSILTISYGHCNALSSSC